jgi:gliding motility-associated lipoprotein GldH
MQHRFSLLRSFPIAFALRASSLAALALFLMQACEPARVYEDYEALGKAWSWEETARFEVDIVDTSARYNLFIGLRHEANYGYMNCWLRIRTILPSGDTTTNRLDIRLAEPDGTWLGQCAVDLCTQRELIGDRRRFPEPGTYVFELEQDMRENPLPGIRDVGIRIERLGIE